MGVYIKICSTPPTSSSQFCQLSSRGTLCATHRAKAVLNPTTASSSSSMKASLRRISSIPANTPTLRNSNIPNPERDASKLAYHHASEWLSDPENIQRITHWLTDNPSTSHSIPSTDHIETDRITRWLTDLPLAGPIDLDGLARWMLDTRTRGPVDANALSQWIRNNKSIQIDPLTEREREDRALIAGAPSKVRRLALSAQELQEIQPSASRGLQIPGLLPESVLNTWTQLLVPLKRIGRDDLSLAPSHRAEHPSFRLVVTPPRGEATAGVRPMRQPVFETAGLDANFLIPPPKQMRKRERRAEALKVKVRAGQQLIKAFSLQGKAATDALVKHMRGE